MYAMNEALKMFDTVNDWRFFVTQSIKQYFKYQYYQ